MQAKQLLQDLQQAAISASVATPTANSSASAAQQHQHRPPLVILCGDLNTTPDSTTCQVNCSCLCCALLAGELKLSLLQSCTSRLWACCCLVPLLCLLMVVCIFNLQHAVVDLFWRNVQLHPHVAGLAAAS